MSLNRSWHSLVLPDYILSHHPSHLALGKIFRFGNKPGILVRTPEGDYRAFSAVCTHLQCTVPYRDDFKHICCACHNAHFDLNGRNIAGPPPRPLEEYRVEIRGDDVVVIRQA